MKKKVLALLLAGVMVLTVTGCGEEKKVSQLIDTIGTVTKDSGDAIAAAETAYDELEDSVKEKVSNYDTLTAAREEYENILEELEKEENYNKAMDFVENEEYELAIYLFTDLGDYKDSAEQIEKCKEQMITDTVTVFDGENADEDTTAEAILAALKDNEPGTKRKYQNKHVRVMGKVLSLKSNQKYQIDNQTYTCETAIYLEGGWIIAVNKTRDVVMDAKPGDTIQAIGVIEGFTASPDQILVGHAGHFGSEACISSEETAQEDMVQLISDMSKYKFYRDANTWAGIYKKLYKEDKKNADIITAESMADIFCYPRMDVEKYDLHFLTSVTRVEEVSDVEAGGIGYDYYDQASSGNIQKYANYLKDRGYVQQDKYVSISANGVKEAYLYFVNKYDDSIVAMGQGDGYIRVIVYAK